MARNEYIDEGCEQDCENDIMVIEKIKDSIMAAMRICQSLDEKQAMAYHDFLPSEVGSKLDDILADVVQPIQNKADEGVLYYESN